ncbi:catechol 2,3-dioxygenase [Flavobacterium arsenatis]|uniref:Catechol 2,3-dioxygenase n=1 Tax=Flavobacterium arsenatis TaxID=1484332 RepID=A0ABU1TQ56_9FLAO|nr:VOC family protein [Flavobacterium arsenatis]MDR6968100.1 catechol 2,3-dioxygenase [Flavobacterium arsenatis]
MDKNYKIPAATRIGHVHLKVANLQRSIDFYCGLLGFEITTLYGNDAAFISAGGYHHHIGLNTWFTKDSPRAEKNTVGLFHTAIVYPTKKDLAILYNRLKMNQYPLTGFSDHGVSLAIYLDDPDGNGVELYWDRPKEEWPTKEDGSLEMYSEPLDLADLLKEL